MNRDFLSLFIYVYLWLNILFLASRADPKKAEVILHELKTSFGCQIFAKRLYFGVRDFNILTTFSAN